MIIYKTKIPNWQLNELSAALRAKGWNAVVMRDHHCIIKFYDDEDAAMFKLLGIEYQFRDRSRKIQATWTIDEYEDLARSEDVHALTKSIADEIDKDIIEELKWQAK